MIHITRDGFKKLEWDSTLRKDVEEEFESICCLREGVTEVEDGVTLGDLIRLTAEDEFLCDFISAYSGCDVDALSEEVRAGVKPLAGELRYCTVAMQVEITASHKYKLEKTLTVDMDFHGRGDNEKQWALDLSPLTEFAALPFRLEANA